MRCYLLPIFKPTKKNLITIIYLHKLTEIFFIDTLKKLKREVNIDETYSCIISISVFLNCI